MAAYSAVSEAGLLLAALKIAFFYLFSTSEQARLAELLYNSNSITRLKFIPRVLLQLE